MPRQELNFFQTVEQFPWSRFLEIDEGEGWIKLAGTDDYIIKKEGGFTKLEFYDFNDVENKPVKKNSYITLIVSNELNIEDFFDHRSNTESNKYGYNFLGRNYQIFKKIINGVSQVKVSDVYQSDIQVRGSTLMIKSVKFKELKKEIEKISTKVSSSKSSLLTFLSNQARFDFLNKKTQRTTSTVKGDFAFNIHRFNLTTKKKKKDFLDRLNHDDLSSLGELFDQMLRLEVFDEEYLRRLDDYFIKEKLQDILGLGKEILELKSDTMKTPSARRLVENFSNEEINQLEGIWQKYFEKYLLYLFFSYKKIAPKVELKNLENLEKKFPDFIGVNHYEGIDVIEIKTHLKNVLVWDSSHKNFSFSPEMSKALIQTINYMDAISDKDFKKTKDKKELLSYLNINENLYRPRGIIIISSTDRLCNRQNKLSGEQKERLKRDFTKLRNSIHNIQIFTFDEILGIAEKYIENITLST